MTLAADTSRLSTDPSALDGVFAPSAGHGQAPRVEEAAAQLFRAVREDLVNGVRQTFGPVLRPQVEVAPRSPSWAERLARLLVRPRNQVDVLAAIAQRERDATVLNRLREVAVLSKEESRIALSCVFNDRTTHQTGYDLALEGQPTGRPMVIVSGWACRYRVLPSGRRQIVAFLLPGDIINLCGAVEPVSTSNICALTTLETASAEALLRCANEPDRFPGLAFAIGRLKAQEEEFLVNHVTRLGAMRPAERLTHLMMELHWRISAAGLANGRQMPLPLTRETIGDALGLSLKQTNKAMSALKRRKLLKPRLGRIDLADPVLLNRVASFTAPDPDAYAAAALALA